MKNTEHILDDIARMAGGAVSVVSGVSQNIREEIRTRVEEVAQRMDLVPREDFERLEALVQAQAKRIEALEKAATKPKAKTAKKPAKKATTKKSK